MNNRKKATDHEDHRGGLKHSRLRGCFVSKRKDEDPQQASSASARAAAKDDEASTPRDAKPAKTEPRAFEGSQLVGFFQKTTKKTAQPNGANEKGDVKRGNDDATGKLSERLLHNVLGIKTFSLVFSGCKRRTRSLRCRGRSSSHPRTASGEEHSPSRVSDECWLRTTSFEATPSL